MAILGALCQYLQHASGVRVHERVCVGVQRGCCRRTAPHATSPCSMLHLARLRVPPALHPQQRLVDNDLPPQRTCSALRIFCCPVSMRISYTSCSPPSLIALQGAGKVHGRSGGAAWLRIPCCSTMAAWHAAGWALSGSAR